MANISKNIKKLRTSAKITQQELAEQLNVTRQAVSSWEQGKNQPDIQTIEALAKVLDVSIEEVIYGSKEVRNKKRLTLRMVVMLVICVLSFWVLIVVSKEIAYWVRTHYSPWPNFVLICVFHPICYMLIGSTFMSVVSFFTNVHVKNNKLRKRLIVIGVVSAAFSPIVFLTYIFAIGTIVTQIANTCLLITSYVQYFLFITGGILIYLGVAKEPNGE